MKDTYVRSLSPVTWLSTIHKEIYSITPPAFVLLKYGYADNCRQGAQNDDCA